MDPTPTSVAAMNVTKENRPVLCYYNILITSAGVWLGDNPLSFALPLLLAQMSLIFTGASLLHCVLRRLGQPKAVSHIVAGAILGISVAGRAKPYADTMLKPRSRMQIEIVGDIGLMLFLFATGVKTDVGMIRKAGRKAVAIGLCCIFLPFTLMVLSGYLLKHSLPPDFIANQFLINLAGTWARTSYPVLSCLLDELNLLNSKLGRLAMSATLIGDFTSTVLTAIYTAIHLMLSASNRVLGIGALLSFLALVAFILFVARPVTLWIIRRTPEGEEMDEAYFILVITLALACGLGGELVGQHATVGTFLLGLALPGGPPLGLTLRDRFDALVSGMFVPIFMASAGSRSDFYAITNGTSCGYLLLLIFLGGVGKLVGVVLPCFFCKVPLRDAMALTLMMSSKGIFEVYMLNSWQDAAIVDKQSYAVIVLCIVAFTSITTPILKAIYKPSRTYAAYKRRTVQQSKPDAELRVIACVHNQDDVAPIVDLIKAVSGNTQRRPLCIYVLHLVQLVGHAAAILAPYDKRRGPSDHSTDTEHIMNAFHFVEQDGGGTVSVQPFISISPYATMHDDVCTMAIDKKVSVIFLPFYKHRAIDGSVESMSAFKNMNINVFNYAPCTVAILVVHRTAEGSQFLPGKHLLNHIVVYFFSGPDDREALACAMRVGRHPGIGVTVIRFRLPSEWRESCPEEAVDDELLSDFRQRLVDDSKVVYREEVVKDGEGTIGVIRATSHCFSLLIVGRRNGQESPLTEGLSMWGEHPELGVVGNVLASTDIGGNVATLVVQQQAQVGGTNAAGSFGCDSFAWRTRFSRCKRVVPVDVDGLV